MWKTSLLQGDPKSPYLFVLCMEKFALYINQLAEDNVWLLINLSRGGSSISYLFFVDDVFLFCKARNSQVQLVMEALNSFCAAFALKVNFHKSRAMCSKNMSSRRRDNVMNIPLFGLPVPWVNTLDFP